MLVPILGVIVSQHAAKNMAWHGMNRPHVAKTAFWPLQECRMTSCALLVYAYAFVGGS